MTDNRNRRTLRLSSETTELLESLKEHYGTSENSIIERCIREFADNRTGSDLSVEKRLNRMEEQLFHLMNMINTLLNSLNVSDADYASSENRPNAILMQSENDLHLHMMRVKGKI